MATLKTPVAQSGDELLLHAGREAAALVPIEAVDIDGPSLEDARANVAASPFAGRIALREGELLGAEAAEPQFSELVLTAPGGQRSEAYAALCRDFYL